MAKMTRWICPRCQGGKLAPSRPRRDDARRWCLLCSEKTGRLVERVQPTAEARRAKAKARAREKAKTNRVFKRPRSYYTVGGVFIAAQLHPALHTRVRRTKNRGPARLKDDVATFRDGPWADAHDARAQVIVIAARYQAVRGHIPLRNAIRSSAAVYGVRPRLDSIARAEIEIAELLRAKAAVRVLESA